MQNPVLFTSVAILCGYLLGAIPFGFISCRFWGVDIRTVGSGRTGATNAWRAAGIKAAIPTALGDALKGVAAVFLIRWLLVQLAPDAASEMQILATAAGGGAAILGHNWSVFLGFKGGAGGITCALTCLALNPIVGAMVLVVGAVLIWWARIAAIATLSTGLVSLAGFLVLSIHGIVTWSYMAFAVPASLAILVSLRSNREKLKLQEERVITLW